VAEVGVLTLPAVTGNVVIVEPCGTVTDEGMFATAGDALRLMDAPPLSAGEVSATVQVDPAAGDSDAGVQARPLKTGVWRIVTVPLLADVGTAAPLESDEIPFESWIVEAESRVEPATVRVTEATTLLGIVMEFRPHTRQVAVPEPLLQVRDLFAAPMPGEKVAELKSAVE
jgi:hypothetical protein